MRIEWTSYQSPVGVLTILEAREGPLIVEFAERTGRLNLAERLRERAPGAVIDTGPAGRPPRGSRPTSPAGRVRSPTPNTCPTT